MAHSTGATARHGVSARDFTEPQTHIAGTNNVHGVTGNVVGSTDTQTLTNKDLTSGTNTFPTSLATLTTAQALTHKDLTDATNTFPSTLVATSGNQTVAGNKIFTGNDSFTGGSGATPSLLIAPTGDTKGLKIVRGTDTTPTQPLLDIRDHADSGSAFVVSAAGDITANSISCFTVTGKAGNFGHFFGSDTTGLVVQRGTDTSPTADILQVQNNAGTQNFLRVDSTGALINKIPAVSAIVTASVTGVAGTETTLATAPAITGDGTTKVRVDFSWGAVSSATAGETWEIRLKDGATVLHTLRLINQTVSTSEAGGHMMTIITPSSGSHTITAVAIRIAGASTGTWGASSTSPMTLSVQQFI